MLTDIEIAQQTKLRPIAEIAEELGVHTEELEPYGRFKAKLNDDLVKRLEDKQDGKLILVTAINPTPAGEGKTTTTAGLGQAMAKIGKKAVIALREPSLGPVFGVKGGAAGGDADDGGTHVGIENIKKRLDMMINARLEMESKKGIGTKACIFIPKRRDETCIS